MSRFSSLPDRARLSEMGVISTMTLFAVIGGSVGFALRAAVYAVGFKDWMFAYFHTFVSWDAVMNEGMKTPGTYLILCLSFSGFVISILYACKMMKRGRTDG